MKKDQRIDLKVSREEKELLELKAKKANLPLSAYLRNLGLGYPVESKTDYMALSALNVAAGDLGRLGGLFKMWLSNNKHDRRAMFGDYRYENVARLVDEILEQKAELMSIAESLLPKNKQ